MVDRVLPDDFGSGVNHQGWKVPTPFTDVYMCSPLKYTVQLSDMVDGIRCVFLMSRTLLKCPAILLEVMLVTKIFGIC